MNSTHLVHLERVQFTDSSTKACMQSGKLVMQIHAMEQSLICYAMSDSVSKEFTVHEIITHLSPFPLNQRMPYTPI